MPRSRTTVKKGQAGTAHPALKHGAHAQPPATKVRAIEDAIYDVLASTAPVRDNAELPEADRAAVRLCARSLTRLESVSAWIDKNGPLDRKGKPRSAALWEQRLISKATK